MKKKGIISDKVGIVAIATLLSVYSILNHNKITAFYQDLFNYVKAERKLNVTKSYAEKRMGLCKLLTETEKEYRELEEDMAFIDSLTEAKQKYGFFCAYPLDSILKDNIKGTIAFGGRKNRPHEGIDIGGKYGKEINSVEDGIVDLIAYDGGGYGNYIDIKHNSFWKSRYAHLRRKPIVKLGQEVKKGQVIAYVGATGNATKINKKGKKEPHPHLHFEMLKLNKKGIWVPINPLPLIRTEEELRYLAKDPGYLEALASIQKRDYEKLTVRMDSIRKETSELEQKYAKSHY